MEVRDIDIVGSPYGVRRARIRAEVRYESGSSRGEEYWFDVPKEHVSELSTSGNPWMACLLPLAAHTGEPLRIPLPVDAPLMANAERLMRIWSAWYPGVSVVRVEAPKAVEPSDLQPGRAAAFFSGGVDSFFTAVRSRPLAAPAERTPVDDLITVWGFDVPLERTDAFARLRDRHRVVARDLGKHLIDVATNLRSTRWREAQWSYLAHGAGLACIALFLERRFHTAYIAGSVAYRDLHSWGSHPATDPLFSTSSTAIVYDAIAYLRTEKIESLADCAPALWALHVCYESETDENCGVCNKCQRTMLALDICGALARCDAFPRKTIDLRQVARFDCSHPFDFRELQDIRKLALAKGRADAVRAIDRSFARTRRRKRVRAGLSAIRRPVGRLLRPFRRRK
ncbi:MAG TPA: hypothetical protein VJ802_00700 [Gemmatimonadaceae bacterium]|nr:hypothetical protein [Gemmatimonadaceae bacterium]